MKILILQLARFGDIYMTWPVAQGLAAKFPGAQIDYLVRSRFVSALDGLEGIHQIHEFQTEKFFAPLFEPIPDIGQANELLQQEIEKLKAREYDWIINLTFSPVSSFLTNMIASENTKISGYTRFQDGYLKIPDDISAYFYAQVGAGKSNRFHLVDLFMSIAELEAQVILPNLNKKESRDVLFHIGASQKHKSLSAAKWSSVIQKFSMLYEGRALLIGAASEKEISDQIMGSVCAGNVVSMVGETSLQELRHLIAHADLVVGADSAPMHIAALEKTPFFNLSMGGQVQFFETGPRSYYSYVLKLEDESEMGSDEISHLILNALKGSDFGSEVFVFDPVDKTYYSSHTGAFIDFQWQLIRAIYLGEDFPPIENVEILQGIRRLDQINKVMVEQFQAVASGLAPAKIASIIDRGEQIIDAIVQMVPELRPLTAWYQTEKSRLGPADVQDLVERTLDIHFKLEKVLQLYMTTYQEIFDMIGASHESNKL